MFSGNICRVASEVAIKGASVYIELGIVRFTQAESLYPSIGFLS